jgi:hypothetical protein
VSDRERLHRKDPSRTEPLRDWSRLLNPGSRTPPDDSHPNESNGSNGADGAPASDAATRAIELGYQVIEEHLAQGRRVAETFGQGTYDPKKAGAEVQEFLQRAVRYSTEIMPLWLDLMNSIASSDAVRNLFSPVPTPASAPRSDSPRGGGAITVELHSSRPAIVSIDLKQGIAGALMTYGLRTTNPDVLPLNDITFLSNHGNGHPVVRISIPEKQPAGVYTGVIVESASGEAVGTVSVRLAE